MSAVATRPLDALIQGTRLLLWALDVYDEGLAAAALDEIEAALAQLPAER